MVERAVNRVEEGSQPRKATISGRQITYLDAVKTYKDAIKAARVASRGRLVSEIFENDPWDLLYKLAAEKVKKATAMAALGMRERPEYYTAKDNLPYWLGLPQTTH